MKGIYSRFALKGSRWYNLHTEFDEDRAETVVSFSIWNFLQKVSKCLANAKGPCDCSVLCLRPKSSLCSCRHRILDMTSFGFGNADSVHRASNNAVGQFKAVFQVEGNTFSPIFFGYFIADWLLCNFAARSFHTTKLCSRLYPIKIEFYSEKTEKSLFEPHFWGLRGNVRSCLLYTSPSPRD